MSVTILPARVLRRLAIAGVSALALAPAPLAAQPAGQPVRQLPSAPAAPALTAAPGSELTVYLMTMGAGDEVWELFGHNAILIHDVEHHTDVAYNWGLFDFDAPHFIARFLRGTALYSMGGFELDQTLALYRVRNRSVWVQELRLTPAQRVALRDFIYWNEQPENRLYRYDYYRDNCSTRVRDALDRVLNGAIRRATAAVPTGTSYRWHTLRLMRHDAPVYAGSDFILGRPADRPISAWEEMFLPVRMREHLRGVRVLDERGQSVPLVVSERTLFEATRPPEPDRPPHSFPIFLAVGLVLGGVMLLLGIQASRAEVGSGARVGLAIVAGAWSLVAGLLGVAALGAWLFTRHAFMYRNESVLQCSPLSLALLPLVVLAFTRRRAMPVVVAMSAAAVALSVAGVLLNVFPSTRERNADIVALALPAHAGLAWAVRAVARRGG